MAQMCMPSDENSITSSHLATVMNPLLCRQLQLTDVVGVEIESAWNTSAIGTKGSVQLVGCEVH